MKVAAILSGLVLAQTALADYPVVPTYNFSMPVDHFDSSNKDTFNNRFLVNDTYYQPGGPVLVLDLGEQGLDADACARFYAEYNTTSSALRLAEHLNGLVIGVEHRYYGFSNPVPFDQQAGIPTQGVSGYKFLTVEQALEDLAYFANAFNTTSLNLNSVVSSTAGLDPYHTPWIIIGGSYSGSRAVWSRLMHPEVFYAAWSSSAVVETRFDGSIYYNSIYRALPQNCTNDVIAASKFLDDTVASGNTYALENLQAEMYMSAVDGATYATINESFSWTPYSIAAGIQRPLQRGFQTFGPQKTAQVFCDYLEGFNVQSALSNQATGLTVAQTTELVFNNPGGAAPTSDGIAATNGEVGGALAYIALTYASYNAKLAFQNFVGSVLGTYNSPFAQGDHLSWTWQVLTQLGAYQGSNLTNPFNMLSRYSNVTSYRRLAYENEYTNVQYSDFPDLNTTVPLSFGGWDMKASNVMFTNGEFDPWRPLGVQSLDTAAGAPQRKLVQNIPKCNEVSSGTDVFGLLYGGAVHEEDMNIYSSFERGSIDTENPPLYQGLDLFVKAYDAWLPCFNQSRDDIRNGKGVDGQGNSASGSSSSGSGSGSKPKNAAGQLTGSLGSLSIMLLGMMVALLAGL